MAEVKTYLPVSITYTELARYGEWHDDAWVREMANIVAEVRDAINSTEYNRIDTLDELIDAYNTDLRDSSSSLQQAEDDREEESERRRRAEDKYESLKYDLDKDEQTLVIRQLKAEVLARTEEVRRGNQREAKKEQTIRDLELRLADTVEKLNMWTIMNTV